MTFQSILDSVDKYVRLPNWLQFTGLMLAFGGLIYVNHPLGKLVAFVGLGVSAAGFCYSLIYP
jgi:hypothetical protein